MSHRKKRRPASTGTFHQPSFGHPSRPTAVVTPHFTNTTSQGSPMKSRVRIFLAALTAVTLAIFMMGTAMPPKALASQPPDGGPSSSSMPNAVPSSATPQVNNGDVQSLAQVGNLIVIGGNFTSVNGQTYNHVAAFDSTTGALAAAFNPSVNGIVNAVAPGPNSHTVYVGGNFTQIGNVNVTDLALLDLNTGSIATGWQSPSFNTGEVRDVTMRGNHLYVGGTFAYVGGKAHAGLVSLDSNTGAVQTFMNVQLSGQHNPQTTGWVGVRRFAVTADGSKMVAVGNFAQADGAPHVQIVMIDLTGASATINPNWNTTRYEPTCYSWAFSDTVRGISFSPDGSYFVVTSTGGGNPGTLCDAAAKFDTNAQGTDVQPEWVAETGGDSLQGVTVTDAAIFVGGHERWGNDPLGVDSPAAGAVPRAGLAALDPTSGRPLSWNPGRVPLGSWVYNFLATPKGIYLGSDTDYIGNFAYKRQKVAFFPYSGGTQLAATSTGALPGSVFLAGKQSATGTSNVLYRVNAGGSSVQATDNGPDWSADTDATSPYRNSGSNAAGYNPGAQLDSTVPTTTPSTIFDSERWDPADSTEMQWTFPVTAGTPIEVRLYLANRCSCTSQTGQRVFNVSLNGQPWLTNEDLVADVGDQTGTMKAKDITAPATGQVTISFGHVTENPLVNGIEIVRTDQQAPPAGDVDGVSRISFDGSTASAPTSVDNGGISWGQARGAFMVGNKVFYGSTDGFLHSRTYDGATWGSDIKYDPYHDPAWANVQTGNGDTFNGASPSLYSELPNVTGMFYLDGRLYYTEFGNPNLQWRWFSPDSGIVDETHATVTSSVNFSDADGMFYSGGKLYYVTKSDGNLHAVDFASNTVSGQPTTVSGPGVDSVDWRSRALFLYNGKPAGSPNTPPSAAFTSNCQDNGCAFDATGSSDPDGSIASYSWSFGDNKTGTGATPSHSYTDGGTFTVSLTVTDNDGATATTTHDVTVSAPTANAMAYVGSAHSGAGASAMYQELTVPAAASPGDTMLLTLTDGATVTATDPSGVTGWTQLDTYTNSSIKSTVWKKTVATGDPGSTVRVDYTTYQKAVLSVAVYSGVDTTELDAQAIAHAGDSNTDQHTTPALSASAGDWIASYWADKSSATTAWTSPTGVKQRDTSVGTGAGRYDMLAADSGGPVLDGSNGGLTATTDATSTKAIMWTIRLSPAGPPAPNTPPSAAFTSDCQGNGCAFDATGSSDTDGSVASYAWTFGDTKTATGATPSHSYTDGGTYTVGLTVTDNNGATDTITHSVTVSAPTANTLGYVGSAHSDPGAAQYKQLTVPASASVGDTMVLFFTDNATATATGPTGVTGWTQLDSYTNSSIKSSVWTKRVAAGDPGSVVRLDYSTYEKAMFSIAVYSGVDATKLTASAVAHAGDSNTDTHATPAITADTGDWVVSYWADKSAATSAWTGPAGITQRDTATGAGSGRYGMLTDDSGGPVVAGTYGGLTATTDATSSKAIMWTIRLAAN